MHFDDEVLLFTSVEEFAGRPNYFSSLQVTKEDLHRIVGKYSLPASQMAWIKCGLNGCNRLHRHGFVIRMHDGRETHCGHVCGTNEFGVKFDEVVAQAKRRLEAQARRQVIADLRARRSELMERATALVEPCRAMEGRVEALHAELRKHHAFWRRLTECARLGGSIRVEVEPPPQDFGYGKGRKSLRTIGTIAGSNLLAGEVTRHSNVMERLVLPWLDEALREEALANASDKELESVSKKGGNMADTLARTERFLGDGAKLFTAANLQLFELIVSNQLASRDITPQLRASLDRAYALVP